MHIHSDAPREAQAAALAEQAAASWPSPYGLKCVYNIYIYIYIYICVCMCIYIYICV